MKIEKNFPIPKDYNKKVKKYSYRKEALQTMDKMEIGDSILLNKTWSTINIYIRIFGLKHTNEYYGLKNANKGWEFYFQVSEKIGYFRLWRVK